MMDELPQTLSVTLSSLAELAVEWWRLDRWANGAQDAAPHARHVARRLAKFLSDHGLEVVDVTGRAYEPGLAVEVLDAFDGAARLAEEVAADVTNHGTDAQRERMAALSRELSNATERGDVRGVKRAVAALRQLRTQVLYAQAWFWEDWFRHLARPGRQFINTQEATRWIAQGHDALQAGDRRKLEQAVRWLWSLMPPDEQAAHKERAVKPGLKQ
ncbi:MAG: molecular chaperone HscC [Acidobacteriota bacterium]|jgi:hypothetical protein|nr:molecular chaperone HscC [Acidobacteriota bacterium]